MTPRRKSGRPRSHGGIKRTITISPPQIQWPDRVDIDTLRPAPLTVTADDVNRSEAILTAIRGHVLDYDAGERYEEVDLIIGLKYFAFLNPSIDNNIPDLGVLRLRFEAVEDELMRRPHASGYDLFRCTLSRDQRFNLFVKGTPPEELALLASDDHRSLRDHERRALQTPCRGDPAIGEYTEVLVRRNGRKHLFYDGIGVAMTMGGTRKTGLANRVEKHIAEAGTYKSHFYNTLRKEGGKVLFYSNFRIDVSSCLTAEPETSGLLLSLRVLIQYGVEAVRSFWLDLFPVGSPQTWLDKPFLASSPPHDGVNSRNPAHDSVHGTFFVRSVAQEARIRARVAAYKRSPKGRAARKALMSTSAWKNKNKEYTSRPAHRAWRRQYSKTPIGRAMKRRFFERHRVKLAANCRAYYRSARGSKLARERRERHRDANIDAQKRLLQKIGVQEFVRIASGRRYSFPGLSLPPTKEFTARLEFIERSVPPADRLHAQVTILAASDYGRSFLPVTLTQSRAHNSKRNELIEIGLDVFLARAPTSKFNLSVIDGWKASAPFERKVQVILDDAVLSAEEQLDARVRLLATTILGKEVLDTGVVPPELHPSDESVMLLKYLGEDVFISTMKEGKPFDLTSVQGWNDYRRTNVGSRWKLVEKVIKPGTERTKALATVLARTKLSKQVLKKGKARNDEEEEEVDELADDPDAAIIPDSPRHEHSSGSGHASDAPGNDDNGATSLELSGDTARSWTPLSDDGVHETAAPTPSSLIDQARAEGLPDFGPPFIFSPDYMIGSAELESLPEYMREPPTADFDQPIGQSSPPPPEAAAAGCPDLSVIFSSFLFFSSPTTPATTLRKIVNHGSAVVHGWRSLVESLDPETDDRQYLLLYSGPDTEAELLMLLCLSRGLPVVAETFIEAKLESPTTSWRSFLVSPGYSTMIKSRASQDVPDSPDAHPIPYRSLNVFSGFSFSVHFPKDDQAYSYDQIELLQAILRAAGGEASYSVNATTDKVDIVLVGDRNAIDSSSPKLFANVEWLRQCVLARTFLYPSWLQTPRPRKAR